MKEQATGVEYKSRTILVLLLDSIMRLVSKYASKINHVLYSDKIMYEDSIIALMI